MIHRTEESKRKERSLKYKNLKSKSKTNSEAGHFGEPVTLMVTLMAQGELKTTQGTASPPGIP